MKILKSWLQDYIKLDISNDEIAETLANIGIGVESVESQIPDSVVVAEIREVISHPNADRLHIAKVFDGENELQIVCGAPNIEAGQKVPLAKIGSVLSGNFEIKEAEIRGVKSFGMLCAEDELGLGTDHSGIKILPSDYAVGESLNKYIESDAIFDLEITPNRGDCLSHYGIARELAAALKLELKSPEIFDLPNTNDLTIQINNRELCPRYFGAVINNIRIGESPDWLKKRLESCGLRPINNIVDITNYIMLDTGQPLHAFDTGKLSGDTIIIRLNNPDEVIITLDGQSHKLPDGSLLIADTKKAIAIAGIMGGANSEIDFHSTNIILEAAEFTSQSVRKTAKLLNLKSEASYRFERGVDTDNVRIALQKAAVMIAELSGGNIEGVASVSQERLPIQVEIKYDEIRSLLGIQIDNSEIDRILERLGFKVSGRVAISPSWRHDISVWQDLAEEVGRIYGYNKVDAVPVETTVATKTSPYYFREHLKDLLVGSGFTENLSYAFLSENDIRAAKINANNLLEVANPVQEENKYFRNSLVPNMLKSIAKNPSFDPVLLFEIGHVADKTGESTKLCIGASGKRARESIETAISSISNDLHIDKSLFDLAEMPREELERFKIRKPLTFISEINLDQLSLKSKHVLYPLNIEIKPSHYRPVSKFPSMTRDVAFIVDNNTNADRVLDDIYSVSDAINRVELFDQFSSDKFGINKKNIAYHIYLQKMERTMTDAEADGIIQNVVKNIESKYQAKHRDK